MARRLDTSPSKPMGNPGIQLLVGEAEQHLLAVGQMSLLDVDAAVGQHPTSDLDGPCPLLASGQQLTADGVTHVMGQQRETLDAERSHERARDIGLRGHGVVLVRLVGEPEPEIVEEEHPTAGSQRIEDGGIVDG